LKGLSSAYAKTTPEGQAELSRRAGGGEFNPMWEGPPRVFNGTPPELKSAGRKSKSKPVTEMTVDEAIRHYSIQEGSRKLAEAEMTDFVGKGPSQSALRFRKGPAGNNVMRPNSGGVRLNPGQTAAAPTDLDLAEMQVTQPRLAYLLDRTRGGAMKSGKIPKGRKGGKSNKEPELSYAPGVVNDETIDWDKSTKPLVGSGGKEIASQTTLGGGKLSVQFHTPSGPQRGSVYLIDAPSVDPAKAAPGVSYPGVPGKRVSSKPEPWYSQETRFATPEAIKRAAMREYRGVGMAIARQQESDRTMESPSAANARMAGEQSRRENIEKTELRRRGSINKALTSPTSAEGRARMAQGKLATQFGITEPVAVTTARAAKETAEMTDELKNAKYVASGKVVARREPEDELRSNLFDGPKKMYIKDPDNPGSFKQILESDYKGPQ